jgi:hypothetical protein
MAIAVSIAIAIAVVVAVPCDLDFLNDPRVWHHQFCLFRVSFFTEWVVVLVWLPPKKKGDTDSHRINTHSDTVTLLLSVSILQYVLVEILVLWIKKREGKKRKIKPTKQLWDSSN